MTWAKYLPAVFVMRMAVKRVPCHAFGAFQTGLIDSIFPVSRECGVYAARGKFGSDKLSLRISRAISSK
jgi:hypothetical protein